MFMYFNVVNSLFMFYGVLKIVDIVTAQNTSKLHTMIILQDFVS